MNPRDEEIVRCRREGQTLQQVADQFGMTRERVRQIVLKFEPNLTSEKSREIRQSNLDHLASERHQKLSADFRRDWCNLKNLDLTMTCTKLVTSEVELRWVIPPIFLKVINGNSEINIENYLTWSDEDCVNAVRKAATFHFPLRVKNYADLVATGVVHGPSVPLLFKRFGTWSAVCEIANIEYVSALRDYNSAWSESDLKNFVLEFARSRLGVKDSWDNFCKWLEENGDGYPSSATMRNRLGSWREMRSEAYLKLIDELGMDLVKWRTL